MLPQKKTDSFRLEPVPDQHIEVKDKPRRKWYIGETSVWVFLFLYLIAIAYPLLWMVMSAFKNSDDILSTAGRCRLRGIRKILFPPGIRGFLLIL